MQTRAFRAIGNAFTLSTTATSQNTSIAGIGNEIRIDNSANATQLLFRTSDDAADTVATTFNCTVAANSVEVFYIGREQRIAYKMASGTGTVYVTRGEGI